MYQSRWKVHFFPMCVKVLMTKIKKMFQFFSRVVKCLREILITLPSKNELCSNNLTITLLFFGVTYRGYERWTIALIECHYAALDVNGDDRGGDDVTIARTGARDDILIEMVDDFEIRV
jgi:hypothetical protein